MLGELPRATKIIHVRLEQGFGMLLKSVSSFQLIDFFVQHNLFWCSTFCSLIFFDTGIQHRNYINILCLSAIHLSLAKVLCHVLALG